MHSVDRPYDGKYIIMSVGVIIKIGIELIFTLMSESVSPIQFLLIKKKTYHRGTGGIAERGKV